MNYKNIRDYLHLLLLILSCLGLGYGYYYELKPLSYNIPITDYGKFYQANRCFYTGKQIYSATIVHQRTKPHLKKLAVSLNPPFFTILTAFLGRLSYHLSFYTWSLMSLGCGIISLFIISKTLFPNTNLLHHLINLFAFFIYFPTFSCLHYGQITLFLLLFLTLAWYAARQKKIQLASILLGIATNIKLFVALFAVYFFMQKQWRALIVFISTIVLCAILALVCTGPAAYSHYYQALSTIKWFSSSWNVSLYGFLVRLFGGLAEGNHAVLSAPRYVLTSIFSLGSISILMLLGLSLRIQTSIEPISTDLKFSAILIAMLLLSPLGWLYYFPLLLIPGMSLCNAVKHGYRPVLISSSLLVILFISSIPLVMFRPINITAEHAHAIFFGSSLFSAALLALLALIFFLIKTLGRTKPVLNQLPSHGLCLLALMASLSPSVVGIVQSVRSMAHNAAKEIHNYTIIHNPCP